MTSSNAPRPSSMVGPDIACCYHGDEIMRRRLFDARVLYVMRVANVLRSIEAKPVLHDLIICKRCGSRPAPWGWPLSVRRFCGLHGEGPMCAHTGALVSPPSQARRGRGQGLCRSSLVPPLGVLRGEGSFRRKPRPIGVCPFSAPVAVPSIIHGR